MSKWGVMLAVVALISTAVLLGGMTTSPIDAAQLLFGACVVMIVAVLLFALLDSGNETDRNH